MQLRLWICGSIMYRHMAAGSYYQFKYIPIYNTLHASWDYFSHNNYCVLNRGVSNTDHKKQYISSSRSVNVFSRSVNVYIYLDIYDSTCVSLVCSLILKKTTSPFMKAFRQAPTKARSDRDSQRAYIHSCDIYEQVEQLYSYLQYMFRTILSAPLPQCQSQQQNERLKWSDGIAEM